MYIPYYARDFAAVILLVWGASVIIPAAGPIGIASNALDLTVLLFSILSGFVISILWERIGSVRDALGRESAHTINIYTLCHVFGRKLQKKVAEAIDKYTIISVHYPLEMYEKSDAAFLEMFELIEDIKPMGNKQETVYDELLSELEEMEDSRMTTVYTAKLKLLGFLKISIIILGATVIGLLFLTRLDTLYSYLVSFVLSVIVVVVYFVIVQLDKLTFWESEMFEVNINGLYNIMGMTTFYDPELVKQGRHVPKPGEKYRTFDSKERIVTRVWPRK
jgi:hypothetical protein